MWHRIRLYHETNAAKQFYAKKLLKKQTQKRIDINKIFKKSKKIQEVMWNYIYCIKEELQTGFHALVKGLILKVVKKYVLGRNFDNEHYDSKK